MDVEADAIIRALFVRNPDAAYRVTMLAMSLSAQIEAAAEAQRHKSWLTNLFEKHLTLSAAARQLHIIS